MNQALRQKAVVQPGGIIEIHSPELPPGATVDVIVLIDSPPKQTRSLVSFIGAAKGGFATPADVDDFINRERDAWQS